MKSKQFFQLLKSAHSLLFQDKHITCSDSYNIFESKVIHLGHGFMNLQGFIMVWIHEDLQLSSMLL